MGEKGMKRRCWEHDYRSPSFYMITVVTEPRRACLSELRWKNGVSDASLTLSPIGETAREVWRRTSSVYSNVEACECVVMPDHFHGVLWVKERLRSHMGHVIKAFKRVSEEECGSRGLLPPLNPGGKVAAAAAALWEKGYQDTILLHEGQLKAMVNYIADNPRRLAAKLANPELFTVVANHDVAPGLSCPIIGNRHLLDHPLKRQIQVSRSVTPRELAAKKEELLYAAEHGAVLISPCVSAGEKEIARATLEARRPLIVLLTNGFPPHYKPPGRYFDACADGRLLMVAPFPHQRSKQTITREQCLALNEWARAIVGR